MLVDHKSRVQGIVFSEARKANKKVRLIACLCHYPITAFLDPTGEPLNCFVCPYQPYANPPGGYDTLEIQGSKVHQTEPNVDMAACSKLQLGLLNEFNFHLSTPFVLYRSRPAIPRRRLVLLAAIAHHIFRDQKRRSGVVQT